MKVFKPLHTTRQLKDTVYEELKNAIVGLDLEPGVPLREAELSEQFGVSKTPVREALLRLQEEGLVVIEPYKGATVSGYADADMREIYELRELLEGSCARHAAEHMSARDRDRLGGLVADGRALLDTGDVPALADALREFDALIMEQTDNSRIRTQLDNLHNHLVRMGTLTVEIPGRLEKSVAQHEAIAAAIAERDTDAAERLTRLHVRSVMSDQLAHRGYSGIEAPD